MLILEKIIVLTDGQVSNTDEVCRVVQKNNRNARVFTLGIGYFSVTAVKRLTLSSGNRSVINLLMEWQEPDSAQLSL